MSSQQFIVVSFGSLGDVYPFIGVGAKLARRGHHVTLVSYDHFATAATHAGLDFVPVGRWSEVEAQLAGVDVNDWKRVVKILSHIMTAHMAETYDAIAERARPGTKVVAFAPALGARFASERLGLPLATLHLAPAGIRSVQSGPRFSRAKLPLPLWRALAPMMYTMLDRVFDRELNADVAAFRRSLGLPPLQSVRRNMDSDELVIGLFPEWFAPQQADWPSQTSTAHFPLYDPTEARPLPPELTAFLRRGQAPIAFTAGSPTQAYGRFYRAAVDACLALKRRGLLITRYRNDVPERLPPTVMHVEYAAFSRVLPRVAAFAHHAGIGTSAQALRAGIPQLVLPWGIDQFDNAKWLSRLGVAHELSGTSCRGATLASALDVLLSSASVRERCREVAARFEGVDTLSDVCTKLEALGHTDSQPLEVVEHIPSVAAAPL